ncbi:MAG: lycopene cyclase domain-containing protein, partial [Flavobacteriales bacterium]|nr:lycopene cyclase domain-containing protein [Flavobacteriales bacterium]
IWDVWFTAEGVWGFNPDYLVGIDILNLPIEEWLFFICIPYACLFTHHCISVLAYKKVVPSQITAVIAWVLIVSWIIVAIVFNDRLYTVVNFLWAIPLVLFVVIKKRHILQRFFVTYLLIGLPFIIVNGILTGA